MIRNKKLVLFASTLCALAFSVGAQNVAVSASAEAEADSANSNDRDAVSDHTCLRQTGSRIIASANARADARKDKAKRQCTGAPGRSYSREDIDRTGAVDLADALRRLDPSVN